MGIKKSKLAGMGHDFDIYLDKYNGLKTKKISKIIKEFDHDGIHYIYYKFPNKLTLFYNTIRINSSYKWKYDQINERLPLGDYKLTHTIINDKLYYEKELYSNFLTLLLRYNSVQKPLYLLVTYPNANMRYSKSRTRRIMVN